MEEEKEKNICENELSENYNKVISEV